MIITQPLRSSPGSGVFSDDGSRMESGPPELCGRRRSCFGGGVSRLMGAWGEYVAIHDPRTSDVAGRLGLPPHLVQLVLSIEDKRFWWHAGFDPIALVRALSMYVRGYERPQGGSTIPEQLVKLRTGTVRRTLGPRLYRLVKSFMLCRRHDKCILLEEYLSQVYLGRSSYGVFAASLDYFGQPVETLSPAQSFFVAERIALPNCARVPRIVNLLNRPSVTTILGQHRRVVPDTYVRRFGCDVSSAIARAMESGDAR